MDPITSILALMTATLAAVARQAWRLRNETREVALPGAPGGRCAASTAVIPLR